LTHTVEGVLNFVVVLNDKEGCRQEFEGTKQGVWERPRIQGQTAPVGSVCEAPEAEDMLQLLTFARYLSWKKF